MTKGRPCLYTEEVAEEICLRLSRGETLISVCRDEHLPSDTTVQTWAKEDREGFSGRYARAREAGWHSMAEEIIEIADETTFDTTKADDGSERQNTEWISRSRLRVDARKWLLSKMLPKVYGDKVTTEHTGPDGGAVKMEAVVTPAEAYRLMVSGE